MYALRFSTESWRSKRGKRFSTNTRKPHEHTYTYIYIYIPYSLSLYIYIYAYLFCSYRTLRKSPGSPPGVYLGTKTAVKTFTRENLREFTFCSSEASGSLRDDVILESCTPVPCYWNPLLQIPLIGYPSALDISLLWLSVCIGYIELYLYCSWNPVLQFPLIGWPPA